MNHIITVEHLHKQYGAHTAVADISFDVQPGEIFAIVGPNGAGKTTTIESIIGLRRPDSGQIRVLGLNPEQNETELRRRIGVQLQQAALPDRLKVWEALDLFASFYPHTLPADGLLAAWGLTEKRNTSFGNLSGGQKQRLFIALALLNDPEVVFLDELTTGLDPQARRNTWEAVRAIRDQGKTVVLVTHFMEEAEELADRVAIIDHGRLVALDTPAALIAGIRAEVRLRFTSRNGFDPAWLQGVETVTAVDHQGSQVTIQGHGALLSQVVTALAGHDFTPTDLRLEQATLEDVFLALTEGSRGVA